MRIRATLALTIIAILSFPLAAADELPVPARPDFDASSVPKPCIRPPRVGFDQDCNGGPARPGPTPTPQEIIDALEDLCGWERSSCRPRLP